MVTTQESKFRKLHKIKSLLFIWSRNNIFIILRTKNYEKNTSERIEIQLNHKNGIGGKDVLTSSS